jgi:soluble lytic murein transglycosylase
LPLRHPSKSLWSLALAGMLAISAPALAEPADSTSRPDAKASTKPAATKPKKPAKAAKPAKPKTAEKPAARPPGRPSAKPAVKSAAKPKPKAAAKPKAAPAVPLPATRPGGTAPAALVTAPAATALTPAKPAGVEITTIITTPAHEVASLKRAVELARRRKAAEASDIAKSLTDPVAKRLIEWVILRSDDAGSEFSRYTAFMAANPNWPSQVTFRRRAEAALFQDRGDPATIRKFFANTAPLSPKGRLALAGALLAQGDRKGAETLARQAWRNDEMSEAVEARALQAFGDMLTRADHKARMDRRLYERDDADAGLRAANRLGGHEPAIAKARIAMLKRGGNKKLVDAVPAAARNDIGYKFARLQMLRRSNQISAAAELMLTIPNPLDASHDSDEWWVERRLLARELLEHGDAKRAYQVARTATPPTRDNYRAEHQFTAGWIALRFLHDPATAYAHFKKVGEGNDNPISLARAAYWQGRAAEALKRPQEARTHYQNAARYSTAYYGQIARAKAGLGELGLPAPALTLEQRSRAVRLDFVRAAELLYAIDARDLANVFLADLGDKSDNVPALLVLADIAAKYGDARGMLLVGKLALARGLPLEHAAFPTIGVPNYPAIGPEVEPAIVYSIVRQESWFNPRTISSANALGLMQVTPPAGRYIAKKFNVTFDQKRLLNDNVYNVQMGSAEIGDVIKDYRGSYILAFAAYNAGRGRVRDWIARFGDPRDPKVDPIDWVERIPFSETRNYVQRVMENLQVYRVRFGRGTRLLIEADLRRGSTAN